MRAVLAGLLDILNNQIKYTQVWGDSEVETISVPWFYNQSGDERFNQDFYTHYAECMPPRPADGNFDVVPRGVITYTGSSIDAQRITSRYVQGRYVKEIDGQLQSFVSYLYSMPLSVRIDCEMRIDRQVTALKIEQEIREVFYKTRTFYVYYKGMRIGSTVGFPEDITIDKNIQYSFESNNPIKINFQLEIETYQPVFDPTTEMKTTSRMKGIGYNLYPVPEKDVANTIIMSAPQEGAIIPKGIPLWVEWSANSKGKIINAVNLQWCYVGENDFTDIELMVPNHEFYVWNIPETFTTYKSPDVIWEETNDIKISRMPEVKIIPALDPSHAITSSSFEILDEGYFITDSDDTSINIQLEMRSDSGAISYSPDGAVWANVKYEVLDSITVDPSISILFPGSVDYKHIEIHVSSANDSQVVGIINDIKIV
jgi:hypothetical protein